MWRCTAEIKGCKLAWKLHEGKKKDDGTCPRQPSTSPHPHPDPSAEEFLDARQGRMAGVARSDPRVVVRGAAVSIFSWEYTSSNSDDDLAAARNALRRLKTLRHPHVLQVHNIQTSQKKS